MPLRSGPMLDAVERGPFLLPFLSIPLVYYTRDPESCACTALPDWNGLALGGINNPAVKTVVKAVWERWGSRTAEPRSNCSGAFALRPAGRWPGNLFAASSREARFDPLLFLRPHLSIAATGSPDGRRNSVPVPLCVLCIQRRSDRLPGACTVQKPLGSLHGLLSFCLMAGSYDP